MAKIELLGEALLLQKVEVEKSEYELAGPASGESLYDVKQAGPDAPAKAGETVILKPGHYERINITIKKGEVDEYLFAEGKDVAGKVLR